MTNTTEAAAAAAAASSTDKATTTTATTSGNTDINGNSNSSVSGQKKKQAIITMRRLIVTLAVLLIVLVALLVTTTRAAGRQNKSSSKDRKQQRSKNNKNGSKKKPSGSNKQQNKADESDLYKLLGVRRSATTKEIKSAYRRKALDTHPDKNKHLPADEAAEAFRKVVQAFEVLSDPGRRSRYDRTGSTSENAQPSGFGSGSSRGGSAGFGGGGFGSGSFHWNFGGGRYRTVRLKDKFEVQQAQSRVLHVVSLAQLQMVMLDDDDLLERNLLLSFVCAGSDVGMENHVNDEMVFPYPFAAMSAQGIWWEDLLQTVQVRFHRKNDLTELFGIDGERMRSSKEPIFVFGRRGQSLDTASSWPRIRTRDRQAFETWVWQQIEVKIYFVNRHHHAVEVYWIHGNRAQKKMDVQPGERAGHTTMLSHEWYVRDARVDTRRDSPGRYKLSEESSLGSWKITNDTNPQEIIINTVACTDMSGHCTFWKHQGECRKNPNFMAEVCQRSCSLCRVTDNNDKDEL